MANVFHVRRWTVGVLVVEVGTGVDDSTADVGHVCGERGEVGRDVVHPVLEVGGDRTGIGLQKVD